MSDLSLTILAETANDAQAIERLHERTFGPGRFVLSAYRIREHVDHLLDLSFTARIGTLLVGSVRQLPICIGDTKALLLGPLTVEPPFRSRGVGRALLDRALKDAKAGGHRLVLLVGDEPYYAKVGVAYAWLIDLEARVLTAQRLESGRWLTLGVYTDETEARIEPFDVVPLDVADWWPPVASKD